MTLRSPIRIAAASALVMVALAGCGSDEASSNTTTAAAAAATGPITAADPDAFVAAMGAPGAVLLDVRTPAEFAEGHIDGAINIDFESAGFADAVGALDRDVPYAIYCRSGNRSGQAEAVMAGMGFTSMTDLTGGIGAWTAAGMKVVTG